MGTTHEIFVCDNRETVCSGYVDDRIAHRAQDVLDAWTTGATAAFEDNGRDQPVELRFDSTFAHWNGGKFSPNQIGRVIQGRQYGYRCDLVATLAVDPPQWLRDLVDVIAASADHERSERAKELDDEALDAEVAEWESQHQEEG